MRRLYLLRHAKSSWSDPSLADEERPLAPRGRKAASPGLQDLALRLAPGSERLVEKFPTGALAAFELDAESWRDLTQTEARLAAYVVPREL